MSTLFDAPRLGLAATRLAHADRHGLVRLMHCEVRVRDGDVYVVAAASPEMPAGEYGLPYQALSLLMLGPGCSITQDALRILARHGVALVATGEQGTRCYSQPAYGAARSEVARAHATLWADAQRRLEVARRMYAIRFGEVLPHRDIAVLRGIEGARVRAAYTTLAAQASIKWDGRRFDRSDPESSDPPNQAINYVVSCVESAAEIAVYAVGALPALGFVHEDSSNAFVLDVADLARVELTVPLAFAATREHLDTGAPLERLCRKACVKAFKDKRVIGRFIDRIKHVLEVA
jgi:CRISPR-associated protein Cas1